MTLSVPGALSLGNACHSLLRPTDTPRGQMQLHLHHFLDFSLLVDRGILTCHRNKMTRQSPKPLDKQQSSSKCLAGTLNRERPNLLVPLQWLPGHQGSSELRKSMNCVLWSLTNL